jgi:hypothetical protein
MAAAMTELSQATTASPGWRGRLAIGSEAQFLRLLVVLAGMAWAVLFIVVGLRYDLQMFGDGSIFSYSVAVADGWRIHWHNISCRLFVLLFCHLPAEAYVKLTADPRGGIVIYGFLFFGAQLFGLVATYVLDRSRHRILFTYACGSTATLCPLVFGFPTEMWIAHALFWPTLAIVHYGRGPLAGPAAFVALLALILSHEGALIFAAAILATLLLGKARNPAWQRPVTAGAAAVAIWIAVRLELPPDAYIAGVLATAALNFIDLSSLALDPMRTLLVALAGYGLALLALSWAKLERAHFYAALAVVSVLTVHVLTSDARIVGENRYYLRTALLTFTPVLGALAAAYAGGGEGRLQLALPYLQRLLRALNSAASIRCAAGAMLVAMSVHVLETERFVAAWTSYEEAVRKLATGTISDPALGDPRFVSANRIPEQLNGLVWASTTHFLSILVAPAFAPARLVVDPDANYFWLPCRTAAANSVGRRAVPLVTRQLVRKYACLHRRP